MIRNYVHYCLKKPSIEAAMDLTCFYSMRNPLDCAEVFCWLHISVAAEVLRNKSEAIVPLLSKEDIVRLLTCANQEVRLVALTYLNRMQSCHNRARDSNSISSHHSPIPSRP